MKKKQDTSRSIAGRLTLTARGFGFVQPDEGPSILVPVDHLGHALSGDRVVVEVFPDSSAQKPAGRVVEVQERNDEPLIGRIRRRGNEVRLYSQGNRSPKALVLPAAELKSARLAEQIDEGDVVSARFLSWPEDQDHPTGRPLEIVAKRKDADLELKLIALSRGLPLRFPPAVEQAAKGLRLPDMDRLARERRDLRDLVCFTIDPETAKDFDDAISIRRTPEGLFEIGVHIADVGYFVDRDSPIDREAWERGTSVYLVDTVLPMLPEHLSNDLCSLVPGQARVTMTVMTTLDSMGQVHKVEMTESIIESRRRFTYRQVEDILKGASDPYGPDLHLLHLVTQVLRRRREEAGSVDLDLPRPQIRVDEGGVPVSVRPEERLAANRMVEECMLLANRTVAQHLESSSVVPGIYRVHDQPADSDIRDLMSTLRDLGVPYKAGEEVDSSDYRAILAVVQNFEFRDLIETLAMKSLKKAVYSTENRGHFGLAMDAYTHFTSPIRRYPDLVVHRLLKMSLAATAGRRGPRRRRGRGGGKALQEYLDKTCLQAGERERLATDAEREYSRLKALEFLAGKTGREYAGVVSGVAGIGLFVEIERYLIEGLVHISQLGKERFEFDRAAYRLVGSRTGTTYKLGDSLRVRVKSVNPQERKADFELVG